MQTELSKKLAQHTRRRFVIGGGVLALVIAAMALDTTVVTIGSDQDAREQAFSPDAYAAKEYPRVQKHIVDNAVDANILMAAIQQNGKKAAEPFGVMSGIGPTIPIKLSGVAGLSKGGIYEIEVSDWPENHKIRVQAGPAINGTDIRDATGDIIFGQFKNQIEYQNVGAALNRAMKSSVLEQIDVSNLAGKTVEITGVFKLINPKNWLITPVRFDVK